MISHTRRLYDWMGSMVYSPYANPVLCFLFYLEAIFFLPTDPMLIIYCIERREKAMFYATIATIGSVLGGVTSYFLGWYLWQTMGESIIYNRYINYLFSPHTLHNSMHLYRKYEIWAILIAGFTPIPYKAATLTAGFCSLSLIPFIICSAIARGARFYLLAIIIKIFGEHFKQKIDRYFTLILILTLLVILSTFMIVAW